ncbi:hypothetical protein [Pedomonas mirosovicensis]|nr:hypothetical protein [Pedomonas mirosovicensis]MCH8684952.1 hypothetical protein [Pedomonas mirosovicensis]
MYQKFDLPGRNAASGNAPRVDRRRFLALTGAGLTLALLPESATAAAQG